MSDTPNAFFAYPLNAPINGLTWLANDAPHSQTFTLAAACGNGVLHLLRPGMEKPFAVSLAPESALLTITPSPHGFITGSDGGHLHLTTPQGETQLLKHLPGKFIEHTAYCPHTETIFFATGKQLHSHSLTGKKALELTLPSTIGGLAASPLGPRLAITHYNGATILDTANAKNLPRKLEWQGSHLTPIYSPDGKWLITAMQEQAIHLWKLSDGTDLQMRGYPGKISQFSWSHEGKWLATNGGSGVPLWNFVNSVKGPAGQQATVVADSGSPELLVTAVAMHPKGPFLAVGYADGLALLSHYEKNHAVLLLPPPEDKIPLTHLAWAPDGLHLAVASESGTLTLTDFTQLA